MARNLPTDRLAALGALEQLPLMPVAAHRPGSLAEVLGWLESEAFAQHSDIVSVDLARLVSGVVLQGELGTFAVN